MSIQVAVLWPLPAVSQVPCQLSETSDSRQGWHDQRAGPCWTGQPSVLWTDRHVAVIFLWQAVRAAQEPPTSTRPLSSHLTTNRGEALNSQLGTSDSSPATVQYIHCGLYIRLVSLSGKGTSVVAGSVIVSLCRYSNWMFTEMMIQFKCFLLLHPVKMVYLQGTHTEAGESYSMTCLLHLMKLLPFYNKRHLYSLWSFPLMGVYTWVCVFTPNHSQLPIHCAPVWQVTFGAIQEMYMPFVSMAGSEHVTWPAGQRAREKILISPGNQYSTERNW